MGEMRGPLGRTDDLVTEEIQEELLVYDERADRVTRLNRPAALVWRGCDGNRSRAELLAYMRDELGDVADDDLVSIALDRLAANGLLEDGFEERTPQQTRESRRRFIRRVGTVGIAAAALPAAYSVIAPTPSHAASGSTTCACTDCFCPPCTCPCDGCTSCICV
jgi:hypothetical protein